MNQMELAKENKPFELHKGKWIALALLPVAVLIALVSLIVNLGTGVEGEPIAPIEVLNIEKIKLTEEGFEVNILNSGPKTVTIAQVVVDDSFWNATFDPSETLNRFERVTVYIPYPWVEGDPHEIRLITTNGLIFAGEVSAAAMTPEPGRSLFLQYALIGFYVGVVPVGLGLLWYPFMRRFTMRGTQAILAFTVGLLLFLFVDTIEEGLEMAAASPGVFQGVGLAFL